VNAISTQALDALHSLAAETLRGDLATMLRDRARSIGSRPWEQMNEDEQSEFCEACADTADHILREVVELIATEGRDTAMGVIGDVKIPKDAGKPIEVKVTVSRNCDDATLVALMRRTGQACRIIVAGSEAFEGGDAPKPDKIGSLGLPDPESEYTEADGHGMPRTSPTPDDAVSYGEASLPQPWPGSFVTAEAMIVAYCGLSATLDEGTVMLARYDAPVEDDVAETTFVAIGAHATEVKLSVGAEGAAGKLGVGYEAVTNPDDPKSSYLLASIPPGSLDQVARLVALTGHKVMAVEGGTAKVWQLYPQVAASTEPASEEQAVESADDGALEAEGEVV
jgi:hypothetical protein